MDNESITLVPQGAVKELRIEIRLKNNRLIRLREELGLRPKAMAEQIGTGYQGLLEFESLRRSPVGAKGEWKPSALKIAHFHGVSPSYCWPDVVRGIEKPMAQAEVSAEEAAALVAREQLPSLSPSICDPEQQLIEAQLVDELESALPSLEPRERAILAHRYGLADATERTLQDIAGLSGCSGERVRQLEVRALYKLRATIDPEVEISSPLTDLGRVQSALRCAYSVAHAKTHRSNNAALELGILVTELGPAPLHAARTFELELRRDALWCCMNPYCRTPWRLDKENHTRGSQCCVPCLDQLGARDLVFAFRKEDFHQFDGLRRWTQEANGRPSAGYCF